MMHVRTIPYIRIFAGLLAIEISSFIINLDSPDLNEFIEYHKEKKIHNLVKGYYRESI